MGKYFKYNTDFKPRYPEDFNKIKRYLEAVGTLNCTDEKLEELYAEFSEDKYAAGWLIIDHTILEEFANYLNNMEN